MGGFAWVTLATNDSYSLGALVLAHSLKQAGTTQQLAVLVTPGVTNAMRDKLQTVFNLVQEVNILDSRDEANLKLLKRPELGVTFTKLHCWRLTQYEKCVFLDADTLVLQNCDELFEREEFSAAPDVGWPDCFNSGVFVYRPSNDTFEKLIQFALEKGSFDGGDQGLLNLYFSDWAHKDISKHLPFIYNMCSTACYSYLPAYKQFGADAKIIHFIGATKPWLQYFNTETRKIQPSGDSRHLESVLQRWWDIFCSLIHPQLSPDMPEGRSQHYHSDPSHSYSYYNPPNQSTHKSSSASDFQNDYDPWDDYEQKQSEINQNSSKNPSYSQESTSFHSSFHAQPNESPNTNASFVAEHHSHHSQTQTHDYSLHQTHEYEYNAATQHQESQQKDIHHTRQYDFQLIEPHNEEPQQNYNEPYNDNHEPQEHCNIHHTPQYNYHLIESYNDNHQSHHSEPNIEHMPQEQSTIHHVEHNETHYHDPPPSQSHNDSQYHETHHNHKSPCPSPNREISSLPIIPNECKATDIVSNDVSVAHSSEETENNAGLAGAFARLTLGVARTPEQDAFEGVLRKQAWEVGNIDYMGKDSFDNIWSKISQTLASAPVEAQLATEDVAIPKEAVKETAVKSDTTVTIEPTVAEEKPKVEVPISESLISPPVQTSTPISQEVPDKGEASVVTPVSVAKPASPPIELKSEPQTPSVVLEQKEGEISLKQDSTKSETKIEEKAIIVSEKVGEDSILILEKQPLAEVPVPVEVVSEIAETPVEEIRQTESVKETEASQVHKEIGESKQESAPSIVPKEVESNTEALLDCKRPGVAALGAEQSKDTEVPKSEVAPSTPTEIKSETVTPQPHKDAKVSIEAEETKVQDPQTKQVIEPQKTQSEEAVLECKKPKPELAETKPVIEPEKTATETTQPEIPEAQVTQPTPPVTPSTPPVSSLPQLEKVKALAVESNVPDTPPPSASQDSSPTPPPRKEGKPKKGIPKPKK